jgi:REP element-mobilizing transposase RayT
MRDHRIKHSDRSCTPFGHGTTEDFDFKLCWYRERSNSHKIFNKYKKLKRKPYWGNHFWSRGYCVDTVGLDSEMIRKYVKYKEDKERKEEKQGKLF